MKFFHKAKSKTLVELCGEWLHSSFLTEWCENGDCHSWDIYPIKCDQPKGHGLHLGIISYSTSAISLSRITRADLLKQRQEGA